MTAPRVVDVPDGELRLPLTVYALGFSRSGLFAWVERRRFEEDDRANWWLQVVDLGTNRRVLRRTFRTRGDGVDALCKEHASKVARALEPFGIEGGTGFVLQKPSSDADWLRAELRRGAQDAARSRTRFDVVLRARTGSSRLGSVWRPDPEEGEPPAAAPVAAAIVRSELEPRIALFVTHEAVGLEGVRTTQVWVFGARLGAGAGAHEPAPAELTQAWLRQLEQGGWAFADVVDEARGLVVIHHEVDSANEDAPGRVTAQRLCGQDLARQLPKLESATIAEIRRSDTTSCRNRPGPPLCTIGVANEYTTYTSLIFARGADGKLRLDAIVSVDGLGMVAEEAPHREQAEYVRTQLLRLRATDCAGKTAAVPREYERLDFGGRASGR
jgi:hypothetical protein